MAHGSDHHHHSPHHHHHHHTPDVAARNLSLAFWLNLMLAAIELAGGLWTHSLAIISDALHDFGDALSLGLGYFLQVKSATGPSDHYSYGLRRLSLLSAFISGLVISCGALYIAFEAVMRFNEPHDPYGLGMMGLAIFGIAVNGLAAWKLGHGHSQNEKVLTWHLIEDLLGWIAVLIGSIAIWLLHWTWLDPLMAIAISAFVLFNVVRGLVETISLFLQANPNPEGLRSFREQVEQIPGLIEVHDVHFWSLDGVRHVLSLHAVLKSLGEGEQMKEQIRVISRVLGDCHVTIEVESEEEHCHDDCEHTHE